jgi:AcrR family transcriptional regulator
MVTTFNYGDSVTTTQGPESGRRERKKAATRKTIADTALRLFLARGYDSVTMREVAEQADVATTTLLNYFPTKEALVFHRGADIEASLVAAVTERPAGTSALAALRTHLKARVAQAASLDGAAQFRALVRSTRSLVDHERDLWLRYQETLAVAMAESSGLPRDDQACRLVAAFALHTLTLAVGTEDPSLTLDLGFDVLEHGWPVA